MRVIEVKHWTAAWVDRNPDLVEQEADRVTNKARKIGTTLRKKVANLRRVWDGAFLVTEEPVSKVKAARRGKFVRGVPFHTFRTWRDAVGGRWAGLAVLSPDRDAGPRTGAKEQRVDGRCAETSGRSCAPEASDGLRTNGSIESTRGSMPRGRDRVLLHLYDLSASGRVECGDPSASRIRCPASPAVCHAWAPGIIDSFQDVPGYAGELKFFTVADPCRTLPSTSVLATTPGIRRRGWASLATRFARWENCTIRCASDDAGGTNEPMVHRNLSPRTVLVKHDNSPILTSFEHTRIPAAVTVASVGASSNEWGPCGGARDPRTRPRRRGIGAPTCNSLCASLTALFSEREDEASRKTVETLSGGNGGCSRCAEYASGLGSVVVRVAGRVGSTTTTAAGPVLDGKTKWCAFATRTYRIVSRLGLRVGSERRSRW